MSSRPALELLPFFYALLALFTGVSAGDRVAVAERAPVAACASTGLVQQAQVSQPARALLRPAVLVWRLQDQLHAPLVALVDQTVIFRTAGFAVRLL